MRLGFTALRGSNPGSAATKLVPVVRPHLGRYCSLLVHFPRLSGSAAGPGGRRTVDWVVVGVDNGGTTNNGTILDSGGRFLLDRMAEVPSDVREGPDQAIQSLVVAVERVLGLTGVPISAVRAVGLDTPGPASGEGVISSKGATNFGHAGWRGFDIRGALADRLGLPVIYNNDRNPPGPSRPLQRSVAHAPQRRPSAAL